MKYFVNINSFEELKKAFREYTVKLHPDKGGDATEFAAMMAEYETVAKRFGAAKPEASLLDEWEEWKRTALNTYTVNMLRVGTRIKCYYLFEKEQSLKAAFYWFLTTHAEDSEEERKARHETFAEVEAVVNMTDEEAEAFDWYNNVPAGAGKGGTFGPIYDSQNKHIYYEPHEHAHYITMVTAIITPTHFFFIDAEGCGYTRTFLVPVNYETMPEYIEALEQFRKDQEEKERQEREAEAKAKALYIERCKKWENLMQILPEGGRLPDNYWSMSREERKAAEAKKDAEDRKRHNTARANILAMCRAAFPGVKFSLTTHNGWGGGMSIKWEDGPTVEEFEAATDLDLFTACEVGFDGMTDSTEYYKAQFTDFANKYCDMSYGRIKPERDFTIQRLQEVGEKIRQILTQFADDQSLTNRHANAQTAFTSEELEKVREAFGIVSDDFRRGFYWQGEIQPFNLIDFARRVCRFLHFEQLEKVAEFRPDHGKTYKAIKKALGANVFGRDLGVCEASDYRGGSYKTHNYVFVNIYDLKVGDIVGKVYHSDRGDEFTTLWSSTRKAEQTRRERLAAVGITIDGRNTITAINADVLEALKAEGAEVERQRKEWEEAQKNGEKPNYKTSEKSQKAETQTQSTEGAQPQSVEGVEIVELDGGRIAVTGDTYSHRETLKAFGGWWNRRAQRWEFRADKAQSVREWLAAQQPETKTTPNPDPSPVNGEGGEGGEGETNTHTESAQDEPQPEPTTETHTEPQSHTESEPQPEEPTEGTKGVTISSELAGAFAKVAAIVAAIVALATPPQDEPTPPQSEKGGRIVFAVDDTPELQEIHTDKRTEPQPEPAAATAAPSDRLDALNLARIKAQQLTEKNEHTAALFAELEALAACGVDVSDILRDLQALNDEHRQRGYITAGELQQRQFMREWAQHRAAAILTAPEYSALFGKDKQAA